MSRRRVQSKKPQLHFSTVLGLYNMENSIIIISMNFIIFSLLGLSLWGNLANPVENTCGMNLEIDAGPLIFKNNAPVIHNFNKLKIPGTPTLPAKSFVLALPPGSEIVSIEISYGQPELINADQLSISPPYLPLCLDKKTTKEALKRWQKNEDFLKLQQKPFPEKPIFYSKISHFRNIPFLRISYFPILYFRNKLLFYPKANITIHYKRTSADNRISDWVNKKAFKFFTNWNEMKNYYKINTQEDSFDYVILTKDNLFPAFDSLIMWKNNIGFHTKLVSIDTIIASYPGADYPDKIRNFLIDKYSLWGIHYLLIGGNVDMIPMKICHPDTAHQYATPTDYYYAELTDDWDSDGDGYYGEYGEDSIGFIPEIIVGRIPYNDLDTVSSIAKKTVNFERDTGIWKKRALLLGAYANFGNEDSSGWPSCDGAVLMETIRDSLLIGWSYTRMYEDSGLCPSVYPHEYGITRENVITEWSIGNYAITNWFGHGNPLGAYRKWWQWDDGDSIPEGSEMKHEVFIYFADAHLLDDLHPAIVFSASCSNAAGEENIARSLIGHGAVGTVAATRYAWYTPGWTEPSDGDIMSLDYYFYYYLITEAKMVGDALFDAKVYYFNYLYFPDPWAPDPEWTPQQNMLGFTLFGDPSLVREGVSIQEQKFHEIAGYEIYFYPNPVNSQGYIEYSIPTDGNTTISLFNIIGQKLEILHKAAEGAGRHKISFTKNNLAAGVYFIKIEFEKGDIKIIKRQKIVAF